MHCSMFFSRLVSAASIVWASHFTLGCSGDTPDGGATPNSAMPGESGGAAGALPVTPDTMTDSTPGEQSSAGSGAAPGSGGAAGDGSQGSAGAAAGGTAGELDPGGPLGLDMVRIVAVGDSITQSTCWRALLWQRLSQDFSGRFDFVGSHKSDSGCTPAGYDQDNEGYGSALVTEVANGATTARTCNPACPSVADLAGRFMQSPADVALMHFGTNDV